MTILPLFLSIGNKVSHPTTVAVALSATMISYRNVRVYRGSMFSLAGFAIRNQRAIEVSVHVSGRDQSDVL